jgi:hypothetical protein
VGDPDTTSAELQGVIDRVLEERRKLEDQQPAVKEAAKIATMLPNAADLYRKQIKLGLDDDPRAALKARVILRKLADQSSSSRTRTEAYGPASTCTPRRCYHRPQGQLVGATGFEPATPCTPCKCATRLRHAPTERAV